MKSLKMFLSFWALWNSLIMAAGVSADWQIGQTTRNFIDPGRSRQIPTEIYYPADTEGADVPVADPGPDGFPVVSYGHGRMMAWTAYENYWTALAPAGYITAFPKTEMGMNPDKDEFALDLLFVAHKLQEVNTMPSSIFYQKVGDEFAVLGHSMGGVVTFAAALADPAVTAIANFACGQASMYDLSGITVPSLIFGGSDDYLTPPGDYQIPYYNALSSDCKTLIIITGANHCQYAEYTYACDNIEEQYPDPGITREQQHELTNQFLVPWLDALLKNDAAQWNYFNHILNTSFQITFMHECNLPTWTPSPEFTPTPTFTSEPTPVLVPSASSAGLIILTAALGMLLFRRSYLKLKRRR